MLRVLLAAEPVIKEGEMPARNHINENARAGSRQRARHSPTPARNSAPVSGSKNGRPGIV
ncbi:MAG: hypothetical protein B6I35_08550 [Anaerolineaceae bacterium 4572_32.2]|nr:MAG: hypothetical protein B6I35_08550 [Anaerolineaceae bacterium 4572_32.2]